jgi:hypothetical protein
MKKKTKLPWKFFIANTRKRLWKDNRQMMESIRQNATDRAKQIKQDKHRNLVRYLYNWPAEITSIELKELIQALNYVDAKGKRMRELSMINRLRRKQLIQYDAGLGIWKNLTKLT